CVPANANAYNNWFMPQTKIKLRKRRVRKPGLGTKSKSSGQQDWNVREVHGLRILQSAKLARLPWLVHGFSTRPGGVSELNGEKVLNLSLTDWDSRENVAENRRRFVAALGGSTSSSMQLVALSQVHSDVVHRFAAAPVAVCRGDASIAKQSGLLLAV